MVGSRGFTAAAVAAVVLSGCGGSGNGGSALAVGSRVTHGPIAARVPARGTAVVAFADGAHGQTWRLGIRHLDDGTIQVERDAGDYPSATAAAASSPGACQDVAANPESYAWKERYEWSFRAGSTPPGLSAGRVERALRRSARGLVRSRNDCGMNDNVSARELFVGRRPAAPAISPSGECTGTDGKNAIGFGALPSGVLGMACTWRIGNRAVEGDIKLATAYRWFAGSSVPNGCSGKYSVEAVAVHELGHVFGLGHVSEGAHGNLTMSTASPACSMAPATLGRGDVRALRSLY